LTNVKPVFFRFPNTKIKINNFNSKHQDKTSKPTKNIKININKFTSNTFSPFKKHARRGWVSRHFSSANLDFVHRFRARRIDLLEGWTMCTLIVAHRTLNGTPLLVADNRDENYDRPEEEASWWRPEPAGPKIWSPRDAKAGGTWIGWSEYGVFAGLTNRFGNKPDPDRRSRGEVVLEALMYMSAYEGANAIARWSALDVNPFHLIVADLERAFLVWHTGTSIEIEELGPGVHVLTERSLGAADSAREEYVIEQIEQLQRDDALDREHLAALLSTQRGMGFDDVRVNLPALNYGTRSSVLIEVTDMGGRKNPALVYQPGGFTD
jgi:uncharacterized protein with NRDE domain